MQKIRSEILDEIFVDEYTGGLVGPSLGFAGTIKARPYLLDESEVLLTNIRVLLNGIRPDEDVTLASQLHDGDHVTFLVLVAGGRSEAQQEAGVYAVLIAYTPASCMPDMHYNKN